MKKIKRRLACIMAAAMLSASFAVPMSVYASPATNPTSITINAPEGTKLSGTYSAYKIFNLSYNTTTGSATYTVDSDYESVVNQFINNKSLTDFNGLITWLGAKEADGSTSTEEEAKAREFADYVYENGIKGKSVTPDASADATGTETSVTINTSSEYGYYLVYGSAVNDNGADTKNTVISSVILDSNAGTAPVIELKLDAPSLEKKIWDNDTTADTAPTSYTEGNWRDVADNQIGDTVYFYTKTSVPDVSNYDSYTYIVRDSMSAGLTFGDVTKIEYVSEDGATTDTLYDESTPNNNIIITETNDNETTFEEDFYVSFNLKSLSLAAGGNIYIYYQATLNSQAKVATSATDTQNHNDNTAYLEYSNNPYDNTSKGETTPDTVYDWTFAYSIDKVADDLTTKLPGAKFQIKEQGNENPLVFKKISGDTDIYVLAPGENADNTTTYFNTIETTGNVFMIKGLDDKVEYTITESDPPAGYTKAGDEPVILTAGYEDGTSLLKTLTSDKDEGSLTIKIVNQSGQLLPSTGGIGTKIFYAGGGVLVVGAAVLLITKKRAK